MSRIKLTATVIPIVVCAGLAIGIALWRLLHPPILTLMEERLGNGGAYMTSCQFRKAYDAYRRAAALDGADARALRGMREAATGRRRLEQDAGYQEECR